MVLSKTHASLWPVFVLIGCVGLFAPSVALTAPPVSMPIVKHHSYKPGELLVKYKTNASDADIEASARGRGASVVKKFRRPKNLQTSPIDGWRHLKFPSGTDTKGALEQFARDPLVEHVELNYLISADLVPNDPRFSGQWGLHNVGQLNGIVDADIDAPEAWDIQAGSSAVVVAVIDSGVDYTHPDLSANKWINPGEIAGNGIDDDGNGYIDDVYGINAITGSGNPMDEYGHGTFVAGVVAAAGNNGIGITGTSWNARIMAVKFMDAQGVGNSDDAIESILYAVNNSAKIINASWGYYSFYSRALIDAIYTADDAGVLFVASAGNNSSNSDIFPHYPSGHYGISNMLSVAATDQYDNLGWLSNYGIRSVLIAAPGIDILSTVQTTPNACCYDPSGYKTASGTSAAAPFVAGSAALLLAKNPGLSAISLKAILMTTVDPLSSLKGKIATGGRLNVYNALTCDPTKLLLQTETPAEGFTAYSGEATSIRAHMVTCNGPIANAVVSATFSNGEPAVTLYDDGAHGDGVAGDGLYANYWTPVNIGSLNVTVTATHSNFVTATQTRNGKIRPRVAYLHEAAPFQWIDATVGTPYALSDESSVTIPIGFDFDFYGMTQNSVTISSNGFLAIGGATAPLNSILPDSNAPNALISPFWDDLDPGASGGIFTLLEGVAPNRRLTVAWVGIPHAGGTNPVTFEATLHEGTGDIIFQYQDTDFGNPAYNSGASVTVGVEDYDGLNGTLYSFNQPIIISNTARRFYRSVASSEITYRVSVNVSSFFQSSSGFLAVDMIDGDGVNSNRLKLIQFSTDSTLLAGPILIGDASGSFIPGPALVGDAQFFNGISQATVFGSEINFLLKLTANGEYQPFPDTIAFYFLDENQLPYPTSDPLGTDSLIAFAIDNVQPAPMIYKSSYNQASVTVETVGAPIAKPGGPYGGFIGYPIQFNGSASYDPEGSPLTYAWNFGDGGVGTGVAPTHTYGAAGTYTVSLVVHDGGLRSSPVTTTVKIKLAPVANAGVDQTVYERDTVTLDGRSSYDPDGTYLSYSWTKTAGPVVTLNNPYTATPTFLAPDVNADTNMTFSLLITDADGLTATDTVNVLVKESDADGDGLHDRWELLYFGNLNATATGDLDGDGLSNLQEYTEGTDPTKANPPPAQVGGVSAVAGGSEVIVKWNPVISAASYNIYWSTSPAVNKPTGIKISGAASPYTHAGRVNGTTYYYVVTAVNNSGESVDSLIVSATPSVQKTWSAPTTIDSLNTSTDKPAVAINSRGDAMVVWMQLKSGGNYNIHASRYTVSGGWEAPQIIEGSHGETWSPHVAIDENGNAIALWNQITNNNWHVWTNRYTVGSGWGRATQLDTENYAYAGGIAMDSAGNAFATWEGDGGGYGGVWISRYVIGQGWLPPTKQVINGRDPKISMNANGAAFLISGIYVNDFDYLIEASLFSMNPVTPGWRGRFSVTYNPSGYHYAISGNELAMAIWGRYESGKVRLWAGHYHWFFSQYRVEQEDSYSASNPRIGLDAQGNAIAVWEYSTGSGPKTVWANRYEDGKGWGIPVALQPGATGTQQTPELAVSADGSAVAVWWYTDNSTSMRHLVAAHYRPGIGLKPPQTLFSTSTTLGGGHAISMDSNGNAMAVWEFNDVDILASRYALTISNSAPIANAGPDQTVKQQTSVTLNGAASTDPDGSIAGYAWRQVSGKAVTLSNPTSAIATFTAPRTSRTIDLVFELTVTDNKGATAVDQVKITVVK